MADASAAIRAALVGRDVELDGFLDFSRVEPAECGGLFQGPGLGLFLVVLTCRLAGLAIHRGLPEDARIHPHVLGHAVRQRRRPPCVLVDTHIGGGILRRDERVVREHVGGEQGQQGVGVDETGQVSPVFCELLVVELVLEDIAVPGQRQGAVGARAQRQVDGGLRRIGGKHRIDHDGLAAVGAKLGHSTARLGSL